MENANGKIKEEKIAVLKTEYDTKFDYTFIGRWILSSGSNKL